MLTPEYKETLMTPAGDVFTMVDQDVALLNTVITGDETSVLGIRSTA
jgi:hypothetical protein